jgi:YgiT-type zinc finger domain-containing protein
MQCNMSDCPGEYEPRRVVETVGRGNNTIVIEDVPAEVCTVCGDTLFTAATMRQIEQLLASPPAAARTVPAFAFPLAAASSEAATN